MKRIIALLILHFFVCPIAAMHRAAARCPRAKPIARAVMRAHSVTPRPESLQQCERYRDKAWQEYQNAHKTECAYKRIMMECEANGCLRGCSKLSACTAEHRQASKITWRTWEKYCVWLDRARELKEYMER